MNKTVLSTWSCDTNTEDYFHVGIRDFTDMSPDNCVVGRCGSSNGGSSSGGGRGGRERREEEKKVCYDHSQWLPLPITETTTSPPLTTHHHHDHYYYYSSSSDR